MKKEHTEMAEQLVGEEWHSGATESIAKAIEKITKFGATSQEAFSIVEDVVYTIKGEYGD